MSKHKRPFDQNLVDAILKLNWPLVNKDGVKIFLRDRSRTESGPEHIAGVLHKLKVRDIQLLPTIFKNPYKIEHEKGGKKGKFYYGKRKGKNKQPFIKIIVKINKDCSETIATIYASK